MGVWDILSNIMIPTKIVAGVMKHHRTLQILYGRRPVISSMLLNKRRHPEM